MGDRSMRNVFASRPISFPFPSQSRFIHLFPPELLFSFALALFNHHNTFYSIHIILILVYHPLRRPSTCNGELTTLYIHHSHCLQAKLILHPQLTGPENGSTGPTDSVSACATTTDLTYSRLSSQFPYIFHHTTFSPNNL